MGNRWVLIMLALFAMMVTFFSVSVAVGYVASSQDISYLEARVAILEEVVRLQKADAQILEWRMTAASWGENSFYVLRIFHPNDGYWFDLDDARFKDTCKPFDSSSDICLVGLDEPFRLSVHTAAGEIALTHIVGEAGDYVRVWFDNVNVNCGVLRHEDYGTMPTECTEQIGQVVEHYYGRYVYPTQTPPS